MKTPEAFCAAIINLACNHFDYFRKNPKHLAWVMMHYELIHRAGRLMDHCWDNPKYPIIDAGNELRGQLKNEDDANMLYDAWGICISNEAEFPDVKPNADPRWLEPNKTMQDWINLLTDPNYRYRGLYSNEYRVRDHLLCCIGNGYEWNKDGYLDTAGPSDVPDTIFHGYTRCQNEVRKDIRERIIKYRTHPYIKAAVDQYMEWVNINAGEDEAAKNFINNQWKIKKFGEKATYGPLKDKEPISQKAVAELLRQYKYLCYLSELAKEAKHWDDAQWKKMSEKKYWTRYGYRLDISQITPDFPTHLTTLGPYSFESVISLDIEDGKFDPQKDYRTAGLTTGRRMAEIYKFKKRAPKNGWAALRWLIEAEKWEDQTRKEKYKDEKRPQHHYPLSDYSRLCTMPDNAHDSYWEAGIKTAIEVLQEPPSDYKGVKKYAKSFLTRAKKLGKFKGSVNAAVQGRVNPA